MGDTAAVVAVLAVTLPAPQVTAGLVVAAGEGMARPPKEVMEVLEVAAAGMVEVVELQEVVVL